MHCAPCVCSWVYKEEIDSHFNSKCTQLSTSKHTKEREQFPTRGKEMKAQFAFALLSALALAAADQAAAKGDPGSGRPVFNSGGSVLPLVPFTNVVWTSRVRECPCAHRCCQSLYRMAEPEEVCIIEIYLACAFLRSPRRQRNFTGISTPNISRAQRRWLRS